MARNVSLVLSAKDNLTAPLSKASKSFDQLQRDADKTKAKINELNRQKFSMKIDVDSAKKELRAAEKALDDTKEAAERLEKAKYNYVNLQMELRGITDEAKSAQKQLNSLNSDIQRAENRAGGIGGNAGVSSGQSILSTLGQAGATQMIGNLLSQAANTYVSSAFGSAAGNLFSSTLGGATSGAAIGTAIAPGIGTAIGAGIGSIVGFAEGKIQEFADKDEYFKSMVSEQYYATQEEMQNSLTGGTATASSREVTNLAFKTLMGGSSRKANAWLNELQDFASVTPFGFTDLTSMSKALMSYGIGTDEQMYWMNSIGDAGSALGLSGSDLTNVSTYLGRMNSTDKVTLEYLNPLIERGVPAIEYLAENLSEKYGKEYTAADIYDLISEGGLSGADASRVIVAGMGEQYGGAMEEIAGTYHGLMSTLADEQEQLNAAMGEGYINARKSALEEQIDYLSGETGDGMKEMYSLIGEYQASLENEKERAVREAMERVQDSDAYQEALLYGDGAEMGRLLAEAKANAEAEYTKSKAYQSMVETQEKTINDVQLALADSYWESGYELGKKFNEGILAAQQESDYLSYYNSLSETDKQKFYPDVYYEGQRNYAFGLSYVPYDGYPAVLHEGERVLTASQNRAYGEGVQVTVTGNNFTVREEADIDRIAEALARKVREARELAI